MAGEFETFYQFSHSASLARQFWSVASLIVIMFGVYFVIGAPRYIDGNWQWLKDREKYARAVKQARFSGMAAMLLGGFWFWAISASDASKMRIVKQIEATKYETMQGSVTQTKRVISTPTSTGRSRSGAGQYWYYTEITLQGTSFRMGAGSQNPRFKHYFFDDPPIEEGDFLKVNYVGKTITKIEKKVKSRQ